MPCPFDFGVHGASSPVVRPSVAWPSVHLICHQQSEYRLWSRSGTRGSLGDLLRYFRDFAPIVATGRVQLVNDVAPFETAKLRMLNGAHSLLAYCGLEAGYTYVQEEANINA